MGKLLIIAEVIGAVTGITTGVCLLVRPIREKLLGLGALREGQKCILRSEMLAIYYKHHEAGRVRQYELENFIFLYKAYKALGGNSFIDKIYSEVLTWEVDS